METRIRRISWLYDSEHTFDTNQVTKILGTLRDTIDEMGCQIEPIQVLKNRKSPTVIHYLNGPLPLSRLRNIQIQFRQLVKTDYSEVVEKLT